MKHSENFRTLFLLLLVTCLFMGCQKEEEKVENMDDVLGILAEHEGVTKDELNVDGEGLDLEITTE